MYTLYLIIFTSTPCASVPQILPHSSSHFMSSSFCVFYKDLLLLYVYVCMPAWMCVLVPSGALGGIRSPGTG